MLLNAGGDSSWIDPPAIGISGNGHALMADNTSDDIGSIILQWLRQKGLVE